MDKFETIILNGSKDAIQAINEKIKEQVDSQTEITQRKNLDGDTATWIVIATIANQALPHILNFIKEYVGMKNIKKIKIGDIEVENPTQEIIEKLMPRLNESTSNA